MMVFLLIVLYFLCFLLIGKAADWIVGAVVRLSHRLNLSSFGVSFFILGILTSTPEFSIGINSIIDKKPEIFVGNLIGASLVLFVLIIPILAIFGNGISLAHQLNEKNLIFSLFVVFLPVLLVIDGALNRKEALVLILVYLLLFYFLEKKKGLLEKIHDWLTIDKKQTVFDIGKIILGILIILLISKILVELTLYFAQIFKISSFLISLLLLSIGTNLPELSVAVGSIIKKHKEVAFGDYLGSAVANSLLMGVLVLISGSFRIVNNNFSLTSVIFLFSLLLFYLFSRSKRDISRQEGIALFLVYLLFVVLELL